MQIVHSSIQNNYHVDLVGLYLQHEPLVAVIGSVGLASLL